MAESIGQLIDRLAITNIKTWFTQQWVYDSSKQQPEEFETQKHADIQLNLQKLATLNLERNRLITEIDQALNEALEQGEASVASNIKVI